MSQILDVLIWNQRLLTSLHVSCLHFCVASQPLWSPLTRVDLHSQAHKWSVMSLNLYVRAYKENANAILRLEFKIGNLETLRSPREDKEQQQKGERTGGKNTLKNQYSFKTSHDRSSNDQHG